MTAKHTHDYKAWTCLCGEVEDTVCECGMTPEKVELDHLRVEVEKLRADVKRHLKTIGEMVQYVPLDEETIRRCIYDEIPPATTMSSVTEACWCGETLGHRVHFDPHFPGGRHTFKPGETKS